MGYPEEERDLSEEYAAALDNPLFNDDFRRAFMDAQRRIAEREAPMKAKIDAEVAEIMKQVNAERAAAARGEPPPQPATPPPSTVQVPSTAPTPARAPPTAFNPLLDLGLETVELDTEVLGQMKQSSEDNLNNLMNVLAGIENAVRSERIQLDRINFAIEKAKRQARYAEAERISRQRKAEEAQRTEDGSEGDGE